MASLTASPNPARIGQSVAFLGEGFAASTPVALKIDALGFAAEIASDAGGLLSNDDINDHADQTLTLAAVVANNETVVIAGRTYTFKTTLTGAANEVLIGANASASLDNLKAAINGAAGAGTTYGAGTVPHSSVIAGNKTATTLMVVAREAGAAGNSLGTTETLAGVGNQWGGATLTGGAADPTGFKTADWLPTREGKYLVTATDGTNSASVTVEVFASV